MAKRDRRGRSMRNECPIRFSLSSSLRTLNAGEMTQRMSDMLQLVVVLINTQLNRNDSPNLKQMIRSLELDAFQLR